MSLQRLNFQQDSFGMRRWMATCLVILGYQLIRIGDILFSEAQFKTMKYRPDFPQRFGCIEDARAHCQAVFAWYNTEHRHCGIAFMIPEDVHYGRTEQVLKTRSAALDAAFAANPVRFKGKRPTPQQPPEAVWINPPTIPAHDNNEPVEQH
jgi:putative transposase